MNFIINENRKNTQLIMNQFALLHNQLAQMDKKFDKLNINNINNQEIRYNNSTRLRYVGQVVNGLPEGKGIMYWNNGDRYEGEWRNDKKEGKGIYYFRSGTRKMGDWKDDKETGKHITLSCNGEVKINNY